MPEFIRVDRLGQAVVVTIDRPSVHNALHPPACAEIGAALDAAEADADVRTIIIAGAGEKSFCAGFDLQYAEARPELYGEPLFGSEIVRRETRRKPMIAAVDGAAFGFGFELALACDLIIASERARFGLPEVKVGLAAMAGGIARLTQLLGSKKSLEYLLTGRAIAADEAERLGIVNALAESPMDVALEWAQEIASAAPLSIAATLDMAYASVNEPALAATLDPRRYPAAMAVLASDDAREGRQAFLQKRRPLWASR